MVILPTAPLLALAPNGSAAAVGRADLHAPGVRILHLGEFRQLCRLRGDRRAHHSLVEALRAWALRIAARRDKQIAVVALARRLAVILYALLRDGTVIAPRRSPNRWPRSRFSSERRPRIQACHWSRSECHLGRGSTATA